MIESFSYDVNPARVVFGVGTMAKLCGELERLGLTRALVLTTPFQKQVGEQVMTQLGYMAAGLFSGAAMHTPVDVTEAAMRMVAEIKADCVVAYGGGSTIGLGKAIAFRADLPQIVIPTTYAGSEVTPILGETQDGLKVTKRDARILPEVVIYDPTLTVSLPVGMSMVSGLNAMAHAIEGLYAKDRNPISSLQAVEAVQALRSALPDVMADPANLTARGRAFYGSWLCGSVLGTVGMALHHKLCHTLGGSFDLPHAETHAVILPHSIAYNQAAAAAELAPLNAIFGPDIGAGIYDLAIELNAPVALRDFGLKEADLDKVTDLAVSNPYWNPRPIERKPLRQLLQAAWEGLRPAT